MKKTIQKIAVLAFSLSVFMLIKRIHAKQKEKTDELIEEKQFIDVFMEFSAPE